MTTKIEWAQSDDGSAGETWNPTRGCSLVSAGCRSCYAMRQAHRFSGPGQRYEGLTKMTPSGPQWTGVVRTVPKALDKPLRWRKPRRVFVDSMSDLFHEDVPDEFIDQVFGVMALSQHVGRCRRRECDHEGGSCEGYVDPPTRHQFQVLTKRPGRARDYLSHPERIDRVAKGAKAAWYFSEYALDGMRWPLPNVWLGTSVEDQATADERIPILLDTPAAVRFVSAEPLLSPIDFRHLDADAAGHRWCQIDALTGRQTDMGRTCEDVPRLDWIIVGGESGPRARWCKAAWVRRIVEQCRAAGVACFVKQLGNRPWFDEHTEHADWLLRKITHPKGGDPAEWPADLRIRQFPC